MTDSCTSPCTVERGPCAETREPETVASLASNLCLIAKEYNHCNPSSDSVE